LQNQSTLVIYFNHALTSQKKLSRYFPAALIGLIKDVASACKTCHACASEDK